MDSFELSIVLGDLSEEILPLLNFAAIVRLAGTRRNATEHVFPRVRHLRLDARSVFQIYRPSFWYEAISFLERHSAHFSQTQSLALHLGAGRDQLAFNLFERLRACVPSDFPSLSRISCVDTGLGTSVFGSEHLPAILPHHLTELEFFKIDIPAKTQLEIVDLMAAMSGLHSVRSLKSLAHLPCAGTQDIHVLKQVGKALSVVARKLKHLVFVSDCVSAIRGDVSFADMPDCVDIQLLANDFVGSSDTERRRNDPTVSLDKLLAAIPPHMRSSPPRLYYEYLMPDNKYFFLSPLHHVCDTSFHVESVLKYWLDRGWPIDIEDSEGATPLGYTDDVADFDMLVAAGADPFYQSQKTGMNVLFSCMRWRDHDSLVEHIMRKYLEHNRADLFRDGRGNGLLHFAKNRVLRMLVDQFSSFLTPSGTNHQHQNALFSTLIQWNDLDDPKRIALLLKLGVDPFQPDAEGYTVIHRCLTVSFLQLPLIYVDFIKTRQDLERVWVVQPPNGVSCDKITFIMRLCACDSNEDPELAEWEAILSRILMMCTTEELNAVDCLGRTLLHHCITAKGGPAIDVLTFLLKRFERRHELNLSAGSEPLSFTAARSALQRPDVFQLLLEAGLNFDDATFRGERLLHYSIRRVALHRDAFMDDDAYHIVSVLLELGVDVLRCEDKSNLAPIHLLCELVTSQSNRFQYLFPLEQGRKFFIDLVARSRTILLTKVPTSRGNQDVVDIMLSSSQLPTTAQVFLLKEILKAATGNLMIWKRLILQSPFAGFPSVRNTLSIILDS